MNTVKFRPSGVKAGILGGLIIVANTVALAQNSPDSNNAATTKTATTPASPSPETLKKAQQVGMRPEVTKTGVTLYCWEDATTGTRFKTKKCVDEGQLDAVIEQRQLARDQTKKALGCGSVCGSVK